MPDNDNFRLTEARLKCKVDRDATVNKLVLQCCLVLICYAENRLSDNGVLLIKSIKFSKDLLRQHTPSIWREFRPNTQHRKV